MELVWEDAHEQLTDPVGAVVVKCMAANVHITVSYTQGEAGGAVHFQWRHGWCRDRS